MAVSAGCGDFGADSGDATGGQGSGGEVTGVGGTGNSTGGAPPIQVECTTTNVTPCGGDLTGTWHVGASCMELSGDMDVSLTSLGCPTVPVTGALTTTGSITLNADGTYTDNTHTTGTASFPLEPSCLSVSMVEATCEDIAGIFTAVGWSTAVCSYTGDVCNCQLTVDADGGLGTVVPYSQAMGHYSVNGNSFEIGAADYDYCVAGDVLTVTPLMSGLTGQAVLVRDGGTVGTGGAPGSGGSEGTGGSESSGGSGGGMTVSDKPCDIYDAAPETTCVAAHSTVRALFKDYDGPLYQVRRADGMTQDIGVLSPGGYANAAAQDAFCGAQACTMWRIYDQTGNGNFLHAQTKESPLPIRIDVNRNTNMSAANAKAEKLTVDGHEVYALFTNSAQAYWNDGSQTGMPLGAAPQGVYMVTSGTHQSSGCCYDYGNAQLDRNYHGGPTMDTVYFGSNTIWGTGEGSGPWVMADMEDGMLASGTPGQKGVQANKSLPFPFVTAMEKNNGTSLFALKGADATQPTLTTMWDGALPNSKSPMQKEGAVILGAGGDCCYSNDNASFGTFYEGAIVSGYPSAATDQAIHENVVEARYGQ
jgi:non-reducing end alpha-L-arabinofuranosidase